MALIDLKLKIGENFLKIKPRTQRVRKMLNCRILVVANKKDIHFWNRWPWSNALKSTLI